MTPQLKNPSNSSRTNLGTGRSASSAAATNAGQCSATAWCSVVFSGWRRRYATVGAACGAQATMVACHGERRAKLE